MIFVLATVCRGKKLLITRGIVVLISLFSPFCYSQAESLLDSTSPVRILEKIVDAEARLQFSGSFTYQRENYKVNIYTKQYIDKDNNVYRYIKDDQKDHQGYLRVNGKVDCVTEGFKTPFRITTILQVFTKNDLNDLLNDYDIKLTDKNLTIANRQARELVFTAKDVYHYQYKVAFDESTYFPLQFSFINQKGVLLEQGAFTQFDTITPVTADELSNCQTIGKPQSIDGTSWRLKWLPSGMALTQVTRFLGAGQNDEHLLYTDGLVYFSVFIEQVTDKRMVNVQRQYGATSIVSRKIEMNNQEYLVTVVGEIPFSTAEKIAMSVQKVLK